MQNEIIHPIITHNMSSQFAEFGKGEAGENARFIVSKYPCKRCHQPATHTIDFDLRGGLEQTPSCDPCHELIVEIISLDLLLANHAVPGTFSTNGLGRNVVTNRPILKPGI